MRCRLATVCRRSTPSGWPSRPPRRGCVVAMSGGVDSSVVAAMLADEGYDVVGVTLQLYDHGAALARKGACCAGRDIHDARRVAETIGLPALRARLREPLPRGGDRRVRRRLPRRRDAGALHPLQRAGEVPRPARDRARTSAPTAWRPVIISARTHGPLGARAAPRRGPRPRPKLLPVLDHARAAGLPALSAGRSCVQGRDPRAGAALRAGGGGQARQPGHLLRARTATTPR